MIAGHSALVLSGRRDDVKSQVLLTVYAVVLFAVAPSTRTLGQTKLQSAKLYSGGWPTYVEKEDWVRGETQKLYELGPRQSYQEVSVKDLKVTVDEFLRSIAGK